MKNKIFIFSSLLCLYGISAGYASDCVGAGCDIKPIVFEEFEVVEDSVAPVIDSQAVVVPAHNVKIYSVQPIEPDDRISLWDNSTGRTPKFKTDKTVDWRNGVPIWDDSIASYKYKDFSDWFLEPDEEIVTTEQIKIIEPVALFEQNMASAAATMERIEELLAPKKPSGDLWGSSKYSAQDMTTVVDEAFGDDGCPFETEAECQIWRKKPIVRETVSPRSKTIRDVKLYDFIAAAACNKEISASHPAAKPLLERYKMLMSSAQACCTDGMAYSLRKAGASDSLIYKFLSDDANFYGFGNRCLMMTDHDLDTQYPNTATAVVAADVRNGCLCRGRQWFQAMLAPFEQAYKALPDFKDTGFYYTYKDGLQREVTVSVNNDVQNVLKQLSQCP
ncbi:MAG: hypothetical protein IKZ34_02125 [Alphaproteobacteria bacterium]|nr:hypothetical protein [Alphaproteobacteria bacterium]